MRLGLAANPKRGDAVEFEERFEQIARNSGWDCVRCEGMDSGAPEGGRPDVLAVLGGDGTLLRYAGLASRWDIPILGIHLGRIGFLSEIYAEEFAYSLDRIMQNQYALERHMMLSCRVDGDEPYDCLNDVLLYKKSFSGVAEISVTLDGLPVGRVFCDGIIAATPTGSTAYNISAGGPVIAPGLESITMTPVCPHTLHVKPVVASPQSVWRFTARDEITVICDGMQKRMVPGGTGITVTGSDRSVSFVRFDRKNIFRLIQEKLY